MRLALVTMAYHSYVEEPLWDLASYAEEVDLLMMTMDQDSRFERFPDYRRWIEIKNKAKPF